MKFRDWPATGRGTMEPALNCSVECESRDCTIDPGVSRQEGWGVLRRLCTVALSSEGVQRGRLSPVLCAVMWTLLSAGAILALFFLAFTLRFKNNRIVKMSSPNLNVVTLCGSALTYCSGFLFALEELPAASPRTALQVQMWTLCIGSSLVFGPLLGKTWRLYRVFTQRVPDKRVIIRDIQLLGLVALLILVDILVLIAWGMTDPIQCARSIVAVVKVVEQDVFYSLSQLESCFSLYADVWVVLLIVLKGSLLLYGTYLAGLTSNVSSPPVNQSLTIAVAVCLVTLSMAVSIAVSRLLHGWPNLVYGVISGGIFVCTTATNCLVFVPQLTQWKQFEDELSPSSSHMTKYFNSPSKSMRSMYSEDEIYFLLGENNSMKRLLTEKNAVIDSLQEQVNSAKEKLLRLMSTGTHPVDTETDFNSSSTQTTELQLGPSTPLQEAHSTPAIPSPSLTPVMITRRTKNAEGASEPMLDNVSIKSDSHCLVVHSSKDSLNLAGAVSGDQPQTAPHDPPDDVMDFAFQSLSNSSSVHHEAQEANLTVNQELSVPGNKQSFVSSKQLQEILQDLSVDAISSFRRSPNLEKRPTSPLHDQPSPGSPFHYFYPYVSPYIMRRRRPHFRPSRRRLSTFLSPSVAGLELHRQPGISETKTGPITIGSMPRHHSGDGEDRRECLGWEQQHRRAHRKSTVAQFSGSHSTNAEQTPYQDQYHSSDWESSSSEDDYCCYHRPYESTESLTSETSDSEPDGFPGYCRQAHPLVNFKEDLKPTFV